MAADVLENFYFWGITRKLGIKWQICTFSANPNSTETAAGCVVRVHVIPGIAAGLLLVFFFSHLSNVSVLTLSNTKSSSICGCRER